MTIHSIDQMRLSIRTAPDSSADFVRILGDVDQSDTSVRTDLPRQWPVDDSDSASGPSSERWASA